METSSRTLEYLDATICHEWTMWSRERKGLLKSTSHHGWAQASAAEGIVVSAAVKVGGSLHALVKLTDAGKQELAQAVIPLPRPGPGSKRGKQPVTAPLTLHTAYRGTLTCDAEIVKVSVRVCVCVCLSVCLSVCLCGKIGMDKCG